jgi:endonuclease III
LEKCYGHLSVAGPSDPYEMILYLNCGYPATDAACAKGFEAVKRELGLSPREILSADHEQLTDLLRAGGIVPEKRAARLQETARKVKAEFGGDLKAALKKRLRLEKDQAGKGIKAAKNALREFPVVGEPSADKILLFSRLAPMAAVPSAFVEVTARLWLGRPTSSYAGDYRASSDFLSAALPETFDARQRAYLLLKKHGQQTCKRSRPKCEICPLTSHCAFIQLQAADRPIV